MSGKIAAEDVWTLLGIRPGQRHQDHNEKLGAAMAELGWKRTRLRIDGELSYSYVRGEEPYKRIVVSPRIRAFRRRRFTTNKKDHLSRQTVLPRLLLPFSLGRTGSSRAGGSFAPRVLPVLPVLPLLRGRGNEESVPPARGRAAVRRTRPRSEVGRTGGTGRTTSSAARGTTAVPVANRGSAQCRSFRSAGSSWACYSRL